MNGSRGNVIALKTKVYDWEIDAFEITYFLKLESPKSDQGFKEQEESHFEGNLFKRKPDRLVA